MVKNWINRLQSLNPPLLITLFFGCFGLIYFSISGPHWMHHNGDVNYTYLLSGVDYLSLLPSHINDQPAISVKLVNAILILVIYSFRYWFIGTSLEKDVIVNSELYLDIITLTVFAGLLWSMYRFLKISYSIPRKSLWLFAATGFFFSFITLFNVFVNKPEPYIMIAGFVLSTILVKHFILKLDIHPMKIVACILFGLLSKITFLPFLLPLLFVVTSRVLFTKIVPLLLLFAIPLALFWRLELTEFLHFLGKTTTHSGSFGTGEKGFYDLVNLQTNLLLVLQVNKLLLVVLFIGLMVSIFTKSYSRVIVAMFISYVVLFLFIVKNPSSHYFVACYSILPAYILLAFQNVSLARFATPILVGCLAFLGLRSILYARSLKITLASTQEYIKPIHIQTYYSSSKEFACFQANQTQKYRHSDILTELYPNDTFYTDDKELHTMSKQLNISDLKERIIVVQGTSEVIKSDDRFTLLKEVQNKIKRTYMLSVN